LSSALERSSQSRRPFKALAIAKARKDNAECGFLSSARRESQREGTHKEFFFLIAMAMTQKKFFTISSLFVLSEDKQGC